MLKITSDKNPRILNLKRLEKPRERKSQNLFVIEGLKELSMAIMGGYQIQSVFYCEEIISFSKLENVLGKQKASVEWLQVSVEVFKKLAYRENSGGIVATAVPKSRTLSELKLSEKPLVVVLETVEKPGNLGAILRTADAATIDAVIVCDSQTDIYNPNVIRSSLGCVFTIPVVSTSSQKAIEWLQKKKIACYATALTASMPYYQIDFTKPCAIVMGTESKGISSLWLQHSTQNIIIPMSGKIDSMNVSNAAAVIVFEAKRQRH